MKKLLCTLAVTAAVASSGMAFAEIQHWQKKDITDKEIKTNGDLGLPGIYLWNVTGQDNAPLTCGLYIMQKGDAVSAGDITGAEPLTLDFTYTYDESKVILGGVMTVSKCLSGDKAPEACTEWGNPVSLKKGDLVGFDNGDRILFSTEGYAKAYYCGKYPKVPAS